MQVQFRRAARAVLVALLVAPFAASAQIATPSIPTDEEMSQASWADLSYAHVFKTDIEDLSNAQLQRESALLRIGRRFGEPEDKLKFVGQFTYQLSSYNFFNDHLGTLGNQGLLNTNGTRADLQCGPATLGPPNCGGDLWSDVHQFTFVGMATYSLNDDWTLIGGALFRLSGERGADYSEGISGGGFGGFRHQWSDSLDVGVVVGVLTQIEDNAAVMPLPIVHWKFTDGWQLNLDIHHLGGVGYGPELAWKPNDELDLSLVAAFERRRYRLENSGPTKNFIGDETSAPIVLKADWHPTPNIDLGAFAGVVVGGNIRMETQGGNKVFDKSYKPTPTIGLNGTVRF